MSKVLLTRITQLVIINIIVLYPHIGNAAEGRWISIGNLHNFYQAHGCEPEGDFGYDYQYGLCWPAQFPYQDMRVARGLWIGVTDFDDPVAGTFYPYKVAHCGPRHRPAIETNEFMPVEFRTYGRFPHPEVYVNGVHSWHEFVDEYDINLPVDRLIYNEVNTSVGITMSRSILTSSHQDHDNYFIYEYIFKNTGICNLNGTITHSDTLYGVYFHWQYRNAICNEGTVEGSGINWMGQPGWGTPRDMRWGKNTMNDVLGEDPANPNMTPLFPNTSITVDEFDYSGNILRCFYAWHGKHSMTLYDNIGSPHYQGYEPDGRLGASQFVGVVTLHADMSATNSSNDPYQPQSTMYIQSDEAATFNNDQYDAARMEDEYLRLMSAGHPGNSHAEEVGTGYADIFADGSYSQSLGYGPYTLAPGDSIQIVLAEAVDGLNRTKNTLIGNTWFSNVNGDSLSMLLPDGSATLDPDEYKNTWVYTGKDSLIRTFKQAKQLFDDDYLLPQPPPPPAIFDVISSNDRILLFWSNDAETSPGFAGYKLYRAEGRFETDYQEIFACGLGTSNITLVNSFEDSIVEDSTDYFYYITSFDDGSSNNGIPLESSMFWSRTERPASLTDNPVVPTDLYVSPIGNDNNTGLSIDDPLRTISAAIDMIVPCIAVPNTIYLAAGTYSLSLTGELFMLRCTKPFVLSGISTDSTILDGEGNSRLFRIENTATVKIQNLTLKNGNTSGSGGAIYCRNASLSLDTVIIEMNNADYRGGGIYLDIFCDLNLSKVTIKNNSASEGGGIYSLDAEINFDELNLSNIFSNSSSSIGHDIYHAGETLTDIVVDTFTVLAPNDYYAYPKNLYTFNIINSAMDQVNADFFVSVDGDDSWSGINISEPLKTITRAMEIIYTDENNPHTIYIAAGTYSPSSTGELFPIYGMSNLTFVGVDKDSTILDGETDTELFYLNSDSNIVIENLSVINGSADAHNGGGINCQASDLSLSSLIISNNTGRSGGGIYCSNKSHVQITDVVIKENTATYYGGGIYCPNSIPSDHSSITLSNSTIANNYAGWSGGGLVIGSYSVVDFDSVNRSNIFLNTAPEPGIDIYSPTINEIIEVVLDTFTLLYPVEDYAYPLNKYNFDILNYKIEQVYDDLYVSPTGDNTNSGLSFSEPLQTITHALNLIYADEVSPQTIILDSGIYSLATNGEIFPLVMRNHISITGVSRLETVLDAGYNSSVIICDSVGNFGISNLTVRNGSAENGGGINCINSSPVLSELLISTNSSSQFGGGIHITGNAAPTIYDVRISDNYAYRGGGIACIESNPVIERAVFCGDSAYRGAGVYISDASPMLRHITVTDNIVSNQGAVYATGLSYPVLINSILWNDLISNEVYNRLPGEIVLLYTDIQDGWVGEGNIDIDPLFNNVAEGDFSLIESSPCVDRGIPFYVLDGDTIINLSDSVYNSSAPDLGAIESEFIASIGSKEVLPVELSLHQNYPNPFNPITTIQYALPQRSDVQITIYDLLGRLVTSLISETQAAGYRSIQWDATNVASGMYFYQIRVYDPDAIGAGDYVQTKKMILLK